MADFRAASDFPPIAVMPRAREYFRVVPLAIIALVEDAGQIRAPSRFEVAAQQDGMAIADPGSSRHHQRS